MKHRFPPATAKVAALSLALFAGYNLLDSVWPHHSLISRAKADSSVQTLPFSQNWNNTNLITTNNDWSGVPGIVGYKGTGLVSGTGVDPQTVVADGTNSGVNVNANQTNPITFNTGGVTEFQITDPTIALKGSGSANAPFILISISTVGKSNITVSYNLRDLDSGTNNSVSAFALQYRLGSTGNFSNVPAGFVADATVQNATMTTPVSAVLPADANNQALVQVRVITTDAVGTDENVGVDDISITGTDGAGGPTNPTLVTGASPSGVTAGGSTLLTVQVSPGANPASTGVAVTGDLSAIGGSSSQTFYDDGTNGDAVAGDLTFSYLATVGAGISGGAKSLPVTATDLQARSANANINLTVTAIATGCSVTNTISQIQGSGSVSPLAGQTVTTSGIVTALKTGSSGGYFIQSRAQDVDADPNTSEGVFVFTGSSIPAGVAVGNYVCVSGRVQEFKPSSDSGSSTETELTSSTVQPLATGVALPAPVVLTAADTPSGTSNVDILEKYEGMRVQVNSLTVVGPTYGSVANENNETVSSTNVFYGVIQGVARPFREPGIQVGDTLPTGAPANIPRFDTNPERLRVDTTAQPGSTALVAVAGQTATNVVGPLDYAFRTYTILTDPASTPVLSGQVGPTAVPAPTSNELTVASFNMERFFDTVNNGASGEPVLTQTAFNGRVNKASLIIRNVMLYPDIIGVEEMENLNTLQIVANKVNADAVADGKPNPNYQAYLVEGNDVGGIDVGFLVKTSRVNVLSVQQYGMDTTFTYAGSTTPLNDRPPLVLRATATAPGASQALTLAVIVNHLRSLNSIDDPTDGDRVRQKRRAQAEYLANLIQSFQTANPNDKIVSVGDYNAFNVNDGYVDVMGTIKGTPAPADQVVLASPDLVNPDLTDLVDTLPSDQRYSYVFDGNAQVLDHILLNNNALASLSRFAYARFDADFPITDYSDFTRPERISDHDSPVAYFTLPAAPAPGAVDVTAQVRIDSTGAGYSRSLKQYLSTITITNTSQQAINGPLELVLTNLAPGVTLANGSGTSPSGSPYVTIPGVSSLAPGASASFTLRFNNPSNAPIQWTPQVFSGSF